MLTNGFERKDVRWGTLMPVTVKVGEDILELRARGTMAIVLEDASKIQAAVEGPDDLEPFIRNYVILAVQEAIGECSSRYASFEALAGAGEEVRGEFERKFNEALDAVGISVRAVTIEAIEKT